MEIKFWKFVSLTLIALFNLGLVNAQCGPEAAHCSTCESDGTSCASCFMGFQLDVSATPKVCIPCGTNCLRCNRTDTPCTQCRVANGPDSANIGQCGPCSDTTQCLGVCAKNGAGKCDRCDEGYGVGTQKLCEPCPAHCLQCSANGTAICDICAPGYTVNSANGQCDQCAPNCLKCEKAGKGKCDPDGCEPGYAPNDLGMCDPVPSGATGPNSGGSTTPGGGDGNTTPGGGGGNTTPGGGGGGNTTPGGGGGNTTPGGGGGNTSPGGGGGGNTTPVGGGGGGNTTPEGGEGGEGGNNGSGNGGMDGLSGGRLIALILGVIGGLLLLLFTLIACWYCWRPNACAWREDDEDVSYVVKRYQRQHVCSHECSPCDDPEPGYHNHPWKVKVRKTTILV